MLPPYKIIAPPAEMSIDSWQISSYHFSSGITPGCNIYCILYSRSSFNFGLAEQQVNHDNDVQKGNIYKEAYEVQDARLSWWCKMN